MRFLVDDQLPVALARWIASRGAPAEHASDLGLTGKPDRDIWAHATAMGATIITKDEDFLHIQQVTSAGPSIIWVRLGNTRNAALLQVFDKLWNTVVARLDDGERLIEITD